MTDFIDKAMLIGVGLEKKIKELMVELEKKGKEERREGAVAAEGEGLGPGQRFENRIVEDGVKAVRELLSVLREGKARVEGEACEAAEGLTTKLHLATTEELEVVKEMARVAREKVDALEKRLDELEGKRKKSKD